MKHLWVKASTAVFDDGGKSIRYTCEDFPGVFVYSNAVYIFRMHMTTVDGCIAVLL